MCLSLKTPVEVTAQAPDVRRRELTPARHSPPTHTQTLNEYNFKNLKIPIKILEFASHLQLGSRCGKSLPEH